MGAPKGNKFWQLADYKGMNLKFNTPEELWDKACEYFEWCDDNPLYEMKVFNGREGIVTKDVPKMRAYTLKHLCIFMGCSKDYLNQFNTKDNKEFSIIITRIRDIIYTQKFQGAAADLLNPNIIARELGLIDKTENEHTGEITITRIIKK